MSEQKFTVENIDIDLVDENPKQPRTQFDERALRQLASSLDDYELLQPIGVRAKGGRFELIWGERRLRAAKLTGWSMIPARILNATNGSALLMMGEENLSREDWNPIEKAEFLETLASPKRQGGMGMTNEEIGARYGHTVAWTANLRRLLALPDDFKQRVISGALSESKARIVLKYLDNLTALAAIGEDLDRQPDLWRTRRQFEERASFIAERLQAAAVDHDADLVGELQSQAQRAAQQAGEATEMVVDDRFRAYLPAVAKYQRNRKALLALRGLIDSLLEQLPTSPRRTRREIVNAMLWLPLLWLLGVRSAKASNDAVREPEEAAAKLWSEYFADVEASSNDSEEGSRLTISSLQPGVTCVVGFGPRTIARRMQADALEATREAGVRMACPVAWSDDRRAWAAVFRCEIGSIRAFLSRRKSLREAALNAR